MILKKFQILINVFLKISSKKSLGFTRAKRHPLLLRASEVTKNYFSDFKHFFGKIIILYLYIYAMKYLKIKTKLLMSIYELFC